MIHKYDMANLTKTNLCHSLARKTRPSPGGAASAKSDVLPTVVSIAISVVYINTVDPTVVQYGCICIYYNTMYIYNTIYIYMIDYKIL